ncbi:MAG: protein phosphatase 2C domain-containing protein [Clostridia bacterium]|nr:protein phosphatase 2C domain-containing protein [Clostridia bacterium]
MILTKWRQAQGLVIGNDHVEAKLPCQDNVYYIGKNGIHVLAVSDGAGSKQYSQYGSEIATKSVCEYLIREFDNLYLSCEKYGKTKEEIEESEKLVKESIFNYVKKQILEKADELSVSIDELACTLLFVAKKDEKFLIGHIGDGVIAGLFNSGADESLRVISHPENGEQINITFFMSDPDAIDHFRITATRMYNLSGVMLMSDGPEEVLYHPINGMHINCLKLFHNFNNYTQQEYNKTLDKFLNNQVGKYSYDDLSINILYLSTIDTEKCRLDVFKDVVGDIKNFKQIEDVSAYAKFVDGTTQYPDKDDLSSYWGLNGKVK